MQGLRRAAATAFLELLARSASARVVSANLCGSERLGAGQPPIRFSPIGCDGLQNVGQILNDLSANRWLDRALDHPRSVRIESADRDEEFGGARVLEHWLPVFFGKIDANQ